MAFPCSGIILAGGRSLRLHGQNKSLLEIGGKTIFERLYALYTDFFEEIIVVSNDPLVYLKYDVQVVTDIFDHRSSLTGLHAGLFTTRAPFAFCCACDTPFLQKELVEAILTQVEPRSEAVVPKGPEGFYEPLCAVYAKSCLKPIEAQLTKKELKISKLFSSVRTKTIPYDTLRGADPDLVSFFNVNTPYDLEKAESIYTQRILNKK